MDDLWRQGARALADGIQARSWSVLEVVRSLATRIERVERVVKAWITLDLDRAAHDAALLDATRLPSGPGVAPLAGVPVGIKDVFLTRGMRTGMGSPLFDGFVPATDAAVVARLRSAGALIPGKTVTTSFAGPDPARTSNPWKAGRTPGGSSSGSAAAVASGMVPAALGTQTAGSVLRPSAYCGIVGFKPTHGTISCDGVFPLARSLDTVGIMARSVADVGYVFEALVPSAGLSSASSPAGTNTDRPPVVRLGLVDCGELVASADIKDHTAALARRLESFGAQVAQVRLPADLALIAAAQSVITHVEAASVHFPEIQANGQYYEPGMRALAEIGQVIPATAYEMALRLRQRLSAAVDDWLAPADLLILPTVGEPVPDVTTTGNPALQAIFTFLGLPAVTLPTGFGADGLPRGTQIVAARHCDRYLLAAAEWMQRALDYPLKFPSL
jgi:Asp-tRNA(Asn)/Glu-tRNA(Gln) amidotransferase A subunit family amidase